MAGEALVGRTLGRYQVQAVIGAGGFAVVYRAVDTVLGRTVALKVVDPTTHRDPVIGRRFVLEGQAVASLDHPAIVPVYDAGEQDGVLWLAMRLVEGGSLDQALAAGRRFRSEEVVAVVQRIGSALDHAHSRGIVHRDVKPSNLLLEDHDPYRAHLADFGIAATARTVGRYTTGALGTAAYMAPEQSRPSEVGPPADVYSLACVAYELLAGRRPFPGDDYVALLYAHATHPAPPVGHPAVDAVLARALAKAPADRPPSAFAFAGQLREALLPHGAPPPPPPPPRPAPPPSPSSPAQAGTGDDAARRAAAGAVVAGAAAAAAAGGVAAGAVPPFPVPDQDPTRVERRDATLVQPIAHHPPAVPGPAAGHHPPAGAAGRHGPGGRPPHDPTVVRVSRRGAQRRVVAGSIALLVAAGAVIFALLEAQGSPDRRVNDAAGISYELVSGWDVGTVEPPLTTLRDGDTEVATITHGPTDGTDAVEALAEVDPAVCQDQPVVFEGIDGSESGARCDNPEGVEPATAVGAIAGGQLWVVTVAPGVSGDDRDDFLASIRLAS